MTAGAFIFVILAYLSCSRINQACNEYLFQVTHEHHKYDTLFLDAHLTLESLGPSIEKVDCVRSSLPEVAHLARGRTTLEEEVVEEYSVRWFEVHANDVLSTLGLFSTEKNSLPPKDLDAGTLRQAIDRTVELSVTARETIQKVLEDTNASLEEIENYYTAKDRNTHIRKTMRNLYFAAYSTNQLWAELLQVQMSYTSLMRTRAWGWIDVEMRTMPEEIRWWRISDLVVPENKKKRNDYALPSFSEAGSFSIAAHEFHTRVALHNLVGAWEILHHLLMEERKGQDETPSFPSGTREDKMEISRMKEWREKLDATKLAKEDFEQWDGIANAMCPAITNTPSFVLQSGTFESSSLFTHLGEAESCMALDTGNFTVFGKVIEARIGRTREKAEEAIRKNEDVVRKRNQDRERRLKWEDEHPNEQTRWYKLVLWFDQEIMDRYWMW